MKLKTIGSFFNNNLPFIPAFCSPSFVFHCSFFLSFSGSAHIFVPLLVSIPVSKPFISSSSRSSHFYLFSPFLLFLSPILSSLCSVTLLSIPVSKPFIAPPCDQAISIFSPSFLFSSFSFLLLGNPPAHLFVPPLIDIPVSKPFYWELNLRDVKIGMMKGQEEEEEEAEEGEGMRKRRKRSQLIAFFPVSKPFYGELNLRDVQIGTDRQTDRHTYTYKQRKSVEGGWL